MTRTISVCIACLLVVEASSLGAAERYQSHPPMRPLPTPSDRPLDDGSAKFVDAEKGSDDNPGTEKLPFQSVAHGVSLLQPGDTLCLRGGVYYEKVTCSLKGTAEAPITVRSYPGELAILDGGLREFRERPDESWEPYTQGAPGEFRSTATYPELAASPSAQRPVIGSGVHTETVKVLGNFADSMVPLHGYAMAIDLRSDNRYWNIGNKLNDEKGLYCGPGLWYDETTGRIHARLAHTALPGLKQKNYRGETDPRKLPLVVSGIDIVLNLGDSQHVRIRDLAVRGTRSRTINLRRCDDCILENVHSYGGCPALWIESCRNLKVLDCALRGVSAPWSFRTTEKYRGISTYLMIGSWIEPRNQDCEIANCELTDCHDGSIIGTIDRLRFHHNLVENFNDDGLYLTIDRGAGEDVRIYQNLIRRCLTAFSFAGEGTGQEGKVASIYRNVIDMRWPIHRSQPRGPEEPQDVGSFGSIAGDHGSPIWKPIRFYHNTVLVPESVWRNYYGAGIVRGTRDTRREVFNNIFAFTTGMPGFNFVPQTGETIVDANLHWSYSQGPSYEGDVFAEARSSRAARKNGWFEKSEKLYKPGWMANDVFADPKFAKLEKNYSGAHDLRLQNGSPAIDAGVPLPSVWTDPLSKGDPNKPDLGAIAKGTEPWSVGLYGRIPVTGDGND